MYMIRSAEGTRWSKHKYIDIVNGRYIYPGDTWSGNNRHNSASQKSWKDRHAKSPLENRPRARLLYDEPIGPRKGPSSSDNIREEQRSNRKSDSELRVAKAKRAGWNGDLKLYGKNVTPDSIRKEQNERRELNNSSRKENKRRRLEIEKRIDRLAEQRKQERAGRKAERKGRELDYYKNVTVPREMRESDMLIADSASRRRELANEMDKSRYKYGTFEDKARLFKVKAERITNEIIDKIRNSNIFNNLFGNKRK